eukprot:6097804-Prymnesium_polylepis.1
MSGEGSSCHSVAKDVPVYMAYELVWHMVRRKAVSSATRLCGAFGTRYMTMRGLTQSGCIFTRVDRSGTRVAVSAREVCLGRGRAWAAQVGGVERVRADDTRRPVAARAVETAAALRAQPKRGGLGGRRGVCKCCINYVSNAEQEPTCAHKHQPTVQGWINE